MWERGPKPVPGSPPGSLICGELPLPRCRLHGWKEPRVRVQSRTGPGYLHGALCTSACLVLFRMTPAAPEDGQVAQVASLWQLYPHCIPEVGQGREGAQQGLPLLPEVGVGFWLMPPSSPGLLPPPPLSSQPQCQVGLALSIAGALVGIWFCHSLAAQPWDSPLSSLCLRSLLDRDSTDLMGSEEAIACNM